MSEDTEDLEAKLLAILSQPEETEKVVDAIEKVDAGEEATLSEEARETLASLLQAGMPTPQEIIRDAKIAEHNAEVQRAREEKLAKRRERQAKRGKRRRK